MHDSMSLSVLKKTSDWKKWWEEREMDWEKDYSSTWNHPHRKLLVKILSEFSWTSLLEVGCGSGPNLIAIVKNLPGKQVGGIDVNEDAIKEAQATFNEAFFKVGSVEDIMMSDNSTDVVLSDMTMIYVNNPNKAIKEIKRVARKAVIFSELHSDTWYGRLKLKWTSGYTAHNYEKLLRKHGFRDIMLIKMADEDWPGGQPQKTYGYIIVARVPKR